MPMLPMTPVTPMLLMLPMLPQPTACHVFAYQTMLRVKQCYMPCPCNSSAFLRSEKLQYILIGLEYSETS